MPSKTFYNMYFSCTTHNLYDMLLIKKKKLFLLRNRHLTANTFLTHCPLYFRISIDTHLQYREQNDRRLLHILLVTPFSHRICRVFMCTIPAEHTHTHSTTQKKNQTHISNRRTPMKSTRRTCGLHFKIDILTASRPAQRTARSNDTCEIFAHTRCLPSNSTRYHHLSGTIRQSSHADKPGAMLCAKHCDGQS